MSISMNNLNDRVTALERAKSSIDFKVDTSTARTVSNGFRPSTSGIVIISIHDTRYNRVEIKVDGQVILYQHLVDSYREPITSPIPIGRNQLLEISGGCTCTFIALSSV